MAFFDHIGGGSNQQYRKLGNNQNEGISVSGESPTYNQSRSDREQIELIQDTVLPQVDPKTRIYTDAEGEEWATISYLARILDIGRRFIYSRVNDGRVRTITGRDNRGIKADLVNIAEARALSEKTKDLPQVDPKTGIYTDAKEEEWTTINYLIRILDVSEDFLSSRAEDGRIRTMTGRNSGGRQVNLVNIAEARALVEEIKDLPQVDPKTGIYTDAKEEEWTTISCLTHILDVSNNFLNSRVDDGRIRTITGRDNRGIKADLVNIAEARALSENNNKLAQSMQRELESELNEPNSQLLQDILKLSGVMGADNCIDILYAMRPDAKKILPDKVRNMLAEYLGDSISQNRPFNLDDLDILKDYPDLLSNNAVYMKFVVKIKRDCYAESRKVSSHDLDNTLTVITDYLDKWRQKAKEIGNTDLVRGVDEVERYWHEVLEMEKPESMVDGLKEGRLFPDANQRINIHEILSQKSMLIADEMGLGKSASAIMACEVVRQIVAEAELADGEEPRKAKFLIIAPSNTMATWRRYLSGEDRESGEQVGYFKPGQEPTVVEVGSQLDLLSEEAKTADYLLISQERMNDEYTKLLGEMEFDVVVADEIHKLKNVRAGVRANNFLDIATKQNREGKYLVMLSGTPIPNKIEDVALYLKAMYPEQFAETDVSILTYQIIHGGIVDLRGLLIPKMQMKELAESIEMPSLNRRDIEIELSPHEKELYQVLLDDDEVDASTKMMILRMFLLNPGMLGAVAIGGVENWTKIQSLRQEIEAGLEQGNNIVVYVNGYIEGVLRGGGNIMDQIDLPDSVTAYLIDGKTSEPQREDIQERLNSRSERMVLYVSGQTADVGVDFSGANQIIHYNQPWSEYDVSQQRGRVWRPGQTEKVDASSIITRGTIEEGINIYIQVKERAIEKLLKGVPITEMEQELLEQDSKETAENLEVNPELAAYYISSWSRMLKIFAVVKGIGQEDFSQFLSKYGREYADCYCDLGPRSYQANANRINATIISTLEHMEQQKIKELVAEAETGDREVAPSDISRMNKALRILDLASGPEMLRQHALEEISDNIVSIDLNPNHFGNSKSGMAAVGAMQELPIKEKSVDYVNLALALHYTKFVPSRGHMERITVLQEINRVLKIGGVAIINNIYSVEFKDMEQTRLLLKELGFEFVEGYCGEVISGDNYKSSVITIKKVKDSQIEPSRYKEALSEYYDGIKFKKSGQRAQNTRNTITEFAIDEKDFSINLNEADQKILNEELEINGRAQSLVSRHGSPEAIPREVLIAEGFGRVNNGTRYLLFAQSKLTGGLILIK